MSHIIRDFIVCQWANGPLISHSLLLKRDESLKKCLKRIYKFWTIPRDSQITLFVRHGETAICSTVIDTEKLWRAHRADLRLVLWKFESVKTTQPPRFDVEMDEDSSPTRQSDLATSSEPDVDGGLKPDTSSDSFSTDIDMRPLRKSNAKRRNRMGYQRRPRSLEEIKSLVSRGFSCTYCTYKQQPCTLTRGETTKSRKCDGCHSQTKGLCVFNVFTNHTKRRDSQRHFSLLRGLASRDGRFGDTQPGVHQEKLTRGRDRSFEDTKKLIENGDSCLECRFQGFTCQVSGWRHFRRRCDGCCSSDPSAQVNFCLFFQCDEQSNQQSSGHPTKRRTDPLCREGSKSVESLAVEEDEEGGDNPNQAEERQFAAKQVEKEQIEEEKVKEKPVEEDSENSEETDYDYDSIVLSDDGLVSDGNGDQPKMDTKSNI
ncbi:hypothetical protein FRC18_011403 [Serendipita sp. 400]|nr:hypothetical protein FRC18_011403 [Serendipita sp. 400]